MELKEITVLDLKKKMDSNDDFFIIDIREFSEVNICKIEGAIHNPMADIPNQINQFKKNQQLVIQCRSGVRSYNVCKFLIQNGFSNVSNLKGGILDWITVIDPSLSSY